MWHKYPEEKPPEDVWVHVSLLSNGKCFAGEFKPYVQFGKLNKDGSFQVGEHGDYRWLSPSCQQEIRAWQELPEPYDPTKTITTTTEEDIRNAAEVLKRFTEAIKAGNDQVQAMLEEIKSRSSGEVE